MRVTALAPVEPASGVDPPRALEEGLMQFAAVVTRHAGVWQTPLHLLASSGRRTPRCRRLPRRPSRAQVPCWRMGPVPRR